MSDYKSYLTASFYNDTVTRDPSADNLDLRSSKVSSGFMRPQQTSFSGIKGIHEIGLLGFAHMLRFSVPTNLKPRLYKLNQFGFDQKKSDDEISSTSAGLEVAQSHHTLNPIKPNGAASAA